MTAIMDDIHEETGTSGDRTHASVVRARSRPWTVEEWYALNEVPDGNRFELLDGSLLVSPAPPPPHQYAGDELRTLLHAAAPRDLRVVTAVGVRLATSTVFIPDIVVMTKRAFDGRAPVAADQVHLVAEVVSPSSKTMDRVTKAAVYAAAGIRNYWRLERYDFPGRDGRPLPVLLVHELAGDAYKLVTAIAAGTREVISTPLRVEVDPADLLG